MAAALCASYIGGSINFAATAHALGLVQRGLLAACMAADNLAMGIYLAIIMAVPADTGQPDQSHSPDTQGTSPAVLDLRAHMTCRTSRDDGEHADRTGSRRRSVCSRVWGGPVAGGASSVHDAHSAGLLCGCGDHARRRICRCVNDNSAHV